MAGNLTMALSPKIIPRISRHTATEETVIIMALLETFPPMEPPIRRPQSIRNQYIPTIVPATAALMPTAGLVI